MSLKIFSNNVKGIRGVIKRKKLFKFCSNLPCQYFCLQETHSDVTSETEWKTDWGGNIIFSHGNTNSLGVAILLKTEHKIFIFMPEIHIPHLSPIEHSRSRHDQFNQ